MSKRKVNHHYINPFDDEEEEEEVKSQEMVVIPQQQQQLNNLQKEIINQQQREIQQEMNIENNQLSFLSKDNNDISDDGNYNGNNETFSEKENSFQQLQQLNNSFLSDHTINRNDTFLSNATSSSITTTSSSSSSTFTNLNISKNVNNLINQNEQEINNEFIDDDNFFPKRENDLQFHLKMEKLIQCYLFSQNYFKSLTLFGKESKSYFNKDLFLNYINNVKFRKAEKYLLLFLPNIVNSNQLNNINIELNNNIEKLIDILLFFYFYHYLYLKINSQNSTNLNNLNKNTLLNIQNKMLNICTIYKRDFSIFKKQMEENGNLEEKKRKVLNFIKKEIDEWLKKKEIDELIVDQKDVEYIFGRLMGNGSSSSFKENNLNMENNDQLILRNCKVEQDITILENVINNDLNGNNNFNGNNFIKLEIKKEKDTKKEENEIILIEDSDNEESLQSKSLQQLNTKKRKLNNSLENKQQNIENNNLINNLNELPKIEYTILNIFNNIINEINQLELIKYKNNYYFFFLQNLKQSFVIIKITENEININQNMKVIFLDDITKNENNLFKYYFISGFILIINKNLLKAIKNYFENNNKQQIRIVELNNKMKKEMSEIKCLKTFKIDRNIILLGYKNGELDFFKKNIYMDTINLNTEITFMEILVFKEKEKEILLVLTIDSLFFIEMEKKEKKENDIKFKIIKTIPFKEMINDFCIDDNYSNNLLLIYNNLIIIKLKTEIIFLNINNNYKQMYIYKSNQIEITTITITKNGKLIIGEKIDDELTKISLLNINNNFILEKSMIIDGTVKSIYNSNLNTFIWLQNKFIVKTNLIN
ncbi:hypothetical protein ABK040_003575 [Willaertia magna]